MLTRLQLYACVYCFERDIRTILNTYVDYTSLNDILGETEAAAIIERIYKSAKQSSLDEDPIDFLDLRPSYDLLNRQRQDLPAELASEVRENTGALDVIVPIRQRLMHARPLHPDDSEHLISALSRFSHHKWRQTHHALRRSSDPNWAPEVLPAVQEDRVLHNLPPVDYDETGLIGRVSQVETVASLLKGGRDSVITLTGEGGIGKTALALDVAYQLLDEAIPPFEAILWVTLKQERLTGRGVEQIRDAVTTISSAAAHLGAGVLDDFDGGVTELAELLDGIPTLICLDNLESVSGEDFVRLYERLPNETKYLVTSRHGIGQLERRVQVGPLEEHHAVALLSRMIASRGTPSLTGLTGVARKQIVQELRCSPLAIKWWVLAAAAGRPPAELIHDQKELLAFCVRSVFDRCTPPARRMAIALDVLAGEATPHRLAALTGDSPELAAPALQELTQGSLVQSRMTFSGDMETLVALTETARRFLTMAVPANDPTRLAVFAADAEYRAQEERRLRDLSERSLNPVIIHHRYDRDIPACHKLRQAVLLSKDGDREAAESVISQAREISPDFWEVDRVAAYVGSFYLSPEAVSATYRSAFDKCETEEHRGVCAHFFAGHLARNARDLEGARLFAHIAHVAIGTAETAVGLGNAQVRMGEFEAGLRLLHEAAGEATGKTRLIAKTSWISGQKRWSESCVTQDRNYSAGLQHAFVAVDTGLIELRESTIDSRLTDAITGALAHLARIATQMRHGGLTIPQLKWHEHPPFWYGAMRNSSEWPRAISALRSLDDASREALHLPLPTQDSDSSVREQRDGLGGTILSVLEGYGFIRTPAYPENVFFHQSSLQGRSFSELRIGETVRFQIESDEEDGRIRAEWVKPTSSLE